MSNVLVEVIKTLLDESKYSIVYSNQRSDLELALNWLALNKKIKARGIIHKEGNTYISRVKLKGSYNESADLIQSKFGNFVRVKK